MTNNYPILNNYNTQNNMPQMTNIPPINQQQFYSQVSYLPGRITNTSEDIKAYEVPMNCPASVFPRSDFKEIYIKYWNENGMIDTKVYKLIESENPIDNDVDNPSSKKLENMEAQLNRIERMLKQRNQRPYRPKTNAKEENSK